VSEDQRRRVHDRRVPVEDPSAQVPGTSCSADVEPRGGRWWRELSSSQLGEGGERKRGGLELLLKLNLKNL